jgi:hypothetical protein
MRHYVNSLVGAEIPPQAHIIKYDGKDGVGLNQNRLIDVLRPELTDKSLKHSLKLQATTLPDSSANAEERKLAVQCLGDTFFVGTAEVQEVYEKIDRAIKLGYSNRMGPKQISELQQQNLLLAMQDGSISWTDTIDENNTSLCIMIIGGAGTGKSVTVERSLKLYHQVYWHEETGEAQIVYLTIDLAKTHTLLGYCALFLKKLSSALGPKKFDLEVNVPTNVTVALLKIESLVLTYNIGILNIDSLDNLANWKKEHQSRLLTHFYSLGSIVPIVYTGRTNILYMDSIRNDDSRLLSSLSLGSIYWDPLQIQATNPKERDDRWKQFTKSLWKQQCLRNQGNELTPELQQEWFKACKGVIKFAVHIFVNCQIEAIQNGEERITVELMQSIANRDLKPFKSLLALSKVNEEQILGSVPKLESSKSMEDKKTRTPARKKNEPALVGNGMPEGFKRVPKKDWKGLPETDLRHTFAMADGKNMHEHLKMKKLILTDKELLGGAQFPPPI